MSDKENSSNQILQFLENYIFDNLKLLKFNENIPILKQDNLKITLNKEYHYPTKLKLLSLDDTINLIYNSYCNINNKNTLCEITEEYNRAFFDLENISEDEPNLVYGLIQDFINYCRLNKLKYNDNDKIIITQNINSKHKGLSYHVYLPIVMNIEDLRLLQLIFINKNEKYAPYMDNIIYHKNRFFRCPGQFEPKLKDTSYINKNSCHHFIKIGTIKENNIEYTDFTNDNLKLCIQNSLLQNINNLNYISINKTLFDNDILKGTFYNNYKFVLQALSKNRTEVSIKYYDVIKTHNLNNNEKITEIIAFYEDEYCQDIRKISNNLYKINLLCMIDLDEDDNEDDFKLNKKIINENEDENKDKDEFKLNKKIINENEDENEDKDEFKLNKKIINENVDFYDKELEKDSFVDKKYFKPTKKIKDKKIKVEAEKLADEFDRTEKLNKLFDDEPPPKSLKNIY